VRDNITIGQGLSNVFHYLFAVEPADRKQKNTINPDVQYYMDEFRDIVIQSKDENDETEEERFEIAKQMIIKYNNYGVKVFICEYKERKFYAETWKEYQTRLHKFKEGVKEKRVAEVATNPELYKLFGRTLAKEL
jgi:hypothetical protein